MIIWDFTKWVGRVTLWLLFWPIGLWRSIHHSHTKRDKRIIEELKRS
jgi:hypothetical protein